MCACLLQTLGHLEKAVVLELTLKHVKALTSLLEQQQQKIIALQNGIEIGEQLITHTPTHTLFEYPNDRNMQTSRQKTAGKEENLSSLSRSRVSDCVDSRCVYRAASRQPGEVRGDVSLWLPHVCQGDSSVSGQP